MRKLNYEKLTSDIQNWIKNYVASAGAKGIVLGLSGGIDSSVIAALSVNAIGAENVLGLGLPCESIPQDLEDARAIATHLGITFIISDLTSVYKEFLKVLPTQIKSNKIAQANIKPRLRMTMLYYMGQSFGNYLVAGTGNRTEIAIGYFTKYGDGGVDFEPIGALYKAEVREIARVLGIPEKIINKPPSAGLWEGQTDEDEIGLTYDLLDEIIYRIDHFLGFEGLNQKDVKKVINMIKSAEHKTKMPPMFKIK
ncbi:MAG: NAD+ synthase [Promethearchaeota archaeon]|nr:MAG: NAD+ synthase [Candidatus Lokiarchaeota archaeon]